MITRGISEFLMSLGPIHGNIAQLLTRFSINPPVRAHLSLATTLYKTSGFQSKNTRHARRPQNAV